jgi:hypothetical protein
MNAVEIEQAVSALAEKPFGAAEFPLAFLQAFGNKETIIKRLRVHSSPAFGSCKQNNDPGPRTSQRASASLI